MFVPLSPTEESLAILDKIEKDARDKLVEKCIQSILVLGQDRTPIKRHDLNKLAFPSSGYRIAGAIVQLASKQLYQVFGMRLFEVDDRTKYLLVNAEPEYATLAKQSDELCTELTVLYFILMDIFVSPDEKISEEDVIISLKPLNINSETLKSYLDLFVKKLYLTLKKAQDTKQFSWGPRAVAEIEPENFFIRFLELVEEDSDKNWQEIRKRVDTLKSIRGN